MLYKDPSSKDRMLQVLFSKASVQVCHSFQSLTSMVDAWDIHSKNSQGVAL